MTSTPLRDESRDELGRERPACARHLGAARLARVHVLVHVERPVVRHVSVANRTTVHRQVRQQRLREIERRHPQPRRGLEARRELHGAAADEPQRRARRFVEPRLRSHRRRGGAARRARVRPAGAARGARTSGVPSSPSASTRGGERARRVDDDEVTLVEELRQVVRVRVHDAQVAAVGDHHPHRVTRDATRFGRLRSLPARRSARHRRLTLRHSIARWYADRLAGRVAEQALRTTGTTTRAADDPRCPRPGTPLGASACACRRDRTCTRAHRGSSAARMLPHCSSAAFDDP